MPNTFVKIQTVTVGAGGSSTIDFTSIPQTYTDLKVVLSSRISNASTRDDFQIQFNGSASGYSRRRILAYDNGTVASDSASSQTYFAGTTTANSATSSIFGSLEFYIPNYTSSNNKSISYEETSENNSTSAYILDMQAGLWANSAAITQITLTSFGGRNFMQYSTATLYGIKSS